MTVDAKGRRRLESGILTDVRITADPRMNALLVRAPANSMELIAGYWKEVGVELVSNVIDRGLYNQRFTGNETELHVWAAANRFLFSSLIEAGGNIMTSNQHMAALWHYWNVGDPRGEEPPEAVKRQFELYEIVKSNPNLEEQIAAMKEIYAIATDLFLCIGICTMLDTYAICRDDLMNVPLSIPGAWPWPTPAPSDPFQWFKA